jgi:hypothetical protein
MSRDRVVVGKSVEIERNLKDDKGRCPSRLGEENVKHVLLRCSQIGNAEQNF